jgi:hypothetical protein
MLCVFPPKNFDCHKPSVLGIEFEQFFLEEIVLLFSKVVCNMKAELIIYIISENKHLNGLEDYERFLSQLYTYVNLFI